MQQVYKVASFAHYVVYCTAILYNIDRSGGNGEIYCSGVYHVLSEAENYSRMRVEGVIFDNDGTMWNALLAINLVIA